MRRVLIFVTLAFFVTGAPAITHDAESQKSARERAARQEKARKQEEQRMLEAMQKCDDDARRRFPKDRKARDKHYEECAARAAQP